jgi:hypothetical protein
MNRVECRARVRALIGAGELPAVHPGLARGSGRAGAAAVTAPPGARCLICGGTGPAIAYAASDDRRIHVHRMPCDDVWRVEAARRRPPPATDAAPAESEPSAPSTNDFTRWLGERLERDSAFDSRMEVALTRLRVDRSSAGVRRATRASALSVGEAALRTRIRRLTAAGQLPMWPPATMTAIDPWRPPQAFLETGPVKGPLCAICLKPAPVIEAVFPDGRSIRVHEGCRTVWATSSTASPE